MKKLLIETGKVISAVVVIGAATLFFDGRADASMENTERILDSIADVKQDVEYLDVGLTMVADEISSINDTMKKIKTEMKSHHVSIDRLWWAFRNQDNFSEEQMGLLLDEWAKKNSNLIVLHE